MRPFIRALPLLLVTASLAACHRSAPPEAANATANDAADVNAIESASGPEDANVAVPAEGNFSTGNATDHGNTDHGNTDHGNTDHGNTDHGNTDQ